MALARPFVNTVLMPAIAFGISPVHVEENHFPDDLSTAIES
jgi:hypothetical protein